MPVNDPQPQHQVIDMREKEDPLPKTYAQYINIEAPLRPQNPVPPAPMPNPQRAPQ